MVVAGGGVGVGGTGVLVAPGSLGGAPASPSESIRACGLSQVAVRLQMFLMETQSMAY